MNGWRSRGPASSNNTRRSGSALNRLARTQPALPAPELAIAQQQTFPLELAKYLFHTMGLVEVLRFFDEHFLNVIGMGDLVMLYGPTAIKYDVAVFACQLGAEPAQVPLVSSDKIQPKKVALWPRWIAGIHAISRSLRSARYHAR